MEMNGLMREAYEKLLGIFAKEDAKASLLYNLESDLYSALHWVRYWARSDEEKAFAGECEDRAVDYYQRALECNYDALRRYKETGDEGIPGFRNLLKRFRRKTVFLIDRSRPRSNMLLRKCFRFQIGF